MSVAVHDTPAALAGLGAGRGVEWSPAWLAAEHDRIAPGFRYLAADGAAAVCVPVPHALPHTAYRVWDVLLGPPAAGEGAAELAELRARLPTPTTDALAVVLPGSYRPGLTWADERAIEPVVAAAEALAAAGGASLVTFANVREEPATAPLRLTLARRGYAGAMTAAEAVLDVVHGSLDEYLAGFGPVRRRSLRRERRRFTGAGATVRRGGGELLADDLVALQVALYRRHGHLADAASVRDRFRRARTLPGLRVLRAELDGRPLGYIAFCEEEVPGRRVVGRLAAFADNDVAAYFNLAYYELVGHAIERSLATIHYGTEAYEAKLARGCRLVPLLTYVLPLAAAAEPVRAAAAFREGERRAWLRGQVSQTAARPQLV